MYFHWPKHEDTTIRRRVLDSVAKTAMKELREAPCHSKIGFESYRNRRRTIVNMESRLKRVATFSIIQVSASRDLLLDLNFISQCPLQATRSFEQGLVGVWAFEQVAGIWFYELCHDKSNRYTNSSLKTGE